MTSDFKPPAIDETHGQTNEALPEAPAPWRLTGDAWVFPMAMPREIVEEGSFTPAALRGREAGGFSTAMVVNYTSSNVGPYQEILWMPCFFHVGERKRPSITRIFVSTMASVVNGQRNWGIPKERADFAITAEPHDVEHVVVSQHGRVFADFRVKKIGFSLPVPIVPLPKSLREVAQVHDGREYFYSPSVRGKFAGARFLGGQFDGALFPDLGRGRVHAGVRITDFVMDFPVAEIRPARPVR